MENGLIAKFSRAMYELKLINDLSILHDTPETI